MIETPRDPRGPLDRASLVDWDREFGRKAPLEVEIGSGMGGFALGHAAAHPEVNFIAMEVRKKFAAETGEKGREPLRALGRHRNVDQELRFACYLIPDSGGTVAVGDPVIPL